jgi:DNA-binding MarR family transcriptional regulator
MMFDRQRMCRVRDIYRAITELENRMEAAYGLNLNEAMLLCNLSDKVSMTAGEVGECLGLTQSNASKVIRSLEKKKLLKRSLDKNDKRIMHFQLSKAGEEKLNGLDCQSITLPPLLESCVIERS